MAALDDTTTIEGHVTAAREHAVLVFNTESNEEEWIPRSLIVGGDGLEESDEEIELEIATFQVLELGWE